MAEPSAQQAQQARNELRRVVSLGWAYRIYIDGTYVGTGLTQASARTGAKRMLAIYEKTIRRKSAVE